MQPLFLTATSQAEELRSLKMPDSIGMLGLLIEHCMQLALNFLELQPRTGFPSPGCGSRIIPVCLNDFKYLFTHLSLQGALFKQLSQIGILRRIELNQYRFLKFSHELHVLIR